MRNIVLSGNTNNNKFECGNLNFNNDLTISISNSSFFNNYNYGNGGVM